MIFLFMGISGSGKTYYGEKVAALLGIEFIDADTYHSQSHIEKMRQGIPLTDADRQPWLETLHQLLIKKQQEGKTVILACSALKKAYRATLLSSLPHDIVYLHASYTFLKEQIKLRQNHFFPASLLSSQLENLEEPEKAISICVEQTQEKILNQIVKNLKNSRG